jgi:outer membrane protein assembly factor BamB
LHPGLGVCSPATVEGDRLYVVSSRGELLCLDVHGMSNGNDGPFVDEERYWVKKGEPPVPPGPEDGDLIWRFDMVTELPSCCNDGWCSAVLIHGDFLYVGTSNGVNGGHKEVLYPLAPSLIAVNKHSGNLVAVDDEKIGERLFHGQWSSPALAEMKDRTLIIYGGGDGVCYAFEPIVEARPEPARLKKVWSFDCNPPEYKFRDGAPIDYFAGGRARPPADRRDPGEEAGAYVGPSEIIGTPVVYNNRVYVATGQDPTHGRGKGILHCIDATGSGDITQSGKVWSYTGLDRTMATVAIADGLLYLPDIAGRIHCLDADTGKPHWVHETKSEIWGPALVADGRLYVGTKRGLLVMAAGKEAKVLRSVPLGRVHCPPVAANRTLYVATGKTLWAAQAEGPPQTATAPDEGGVDLGGK